MVKDRRRLTEWEETKDGSYLWTYGCHREVDSSFNHADDRIISPCGLIAVYD